MDVRLASEPHRHQNPQLLGGGDALTADAESRLLAVARARGPGIRDAVIVLLALKAGVDAREQARLDVGHVRVADAPPWLVHVPGRRAVFAPGLPAGAVPIGPALRDELRTHVAHLRDRCHHAGGRFGTDAKRDGSVVCHVCRQLLDGDRVPLLLSRRGDRLSERQLHKLFGVMRGRAGLPAGATFGTLVKTYDLKLRELLATAVLTHG